MVHIERTPLKKILRAVVYRNTKKLPLSEIVEREKPDLAMTGVFYSPAKWAPVCPVKADGTVLFADQQDSYWALGWDCLLYTSVVYYGRQAVDITERSGFYINEDRAWGCLLYTSHSAIPAARRR